MEIKQELTLERQAFDAHMRIKNGFSGLSLENVSIDVWFKDKDELPVLASSDPGNLAARFFIRLDTLENIGNVTGTGVVAPTTAADIHWLIIPSPGSANGSPAGSVYYVGATLHYTMGGKDYTMDVSPDYIFVKPLPELALDYFLPTDVYGDDAFTPEVEPPIPFPLGVRVKNNGYGPAQNLKIESAQPKIVDNAQGLLVDFQIIGADVNGQPAALKLLADFGTLGPARAGVARWFMTSSLSGRFTEFNARFSHADELGGQLTSLITGVTAHALIKDVLTDQPGRDLVPDFLGSDGGALRLYDSENIDAAVTDLSGDSTLQFEGGSGAESRYTLQTTAIPGYGYVKLADPLAGAKILQGVVRSDGKLLKAANAWLSKTRQMGPWQYFVNIFDAGTAARYTLVFADPSAANHPPVVQAIPDQIGVETQILSIPIVATDSDGTVPTLTAASLPAGSTFTDNGDGTGTFNWTPSEGQAGLYEMVFIASDGELTGEKRCRLTIRGVWDTDGDGMADAWEMTWFGSLDRDGTGDFDADGAADLAEYQRGTNPVAGRPPSAPVVQSPLEGGETNELSPLLIAGGSVDPEGQPITYAFELYADASYSTLVASQAGTVPVGGFAQFAVPVNLEDNTRYYWRTRATDGGEFSPWTDADFLVNTANDPPAGITPSYPPNASEVSTPTPVLEITAGRDPDGDALTYSFELYEDEGLSVLLSSAAGLAASGDVARWTVPAPLLYGATFFWRARAVDVHGASAGISAVSFSVNTANLAPPSPYLISPVNGAEISTTSLLVAIRKDADPDADPVAYFIEVDTTPAFDGAGKRVSGSVPQGADTTTWTADGLTDDTTYYVRACASDGRAASEWTRAGVFINVLNNPPSVPVAKSPGDKTWETTLAPLLAVHPAFDLDGDSLAYRFEVADDTAMAHVVFSTETTDAFCRVSPAQADASWRYWRVLARDAHGAQSGWMPVSSFYIRDDGQDLPPAIALLEPSAPVYTTGGPVLIKWHDEDPDSSAVVSLFFDTDGSGADGALIAQGLPEDPDGLYDQYLWSAAALPEGTYHVYAVITDGVSSWTAYSTNTVTVDRTAPAVHAEPAGGIYLSSQTVSLISSEPSVIRYTLDGTTPGVGSPVYQGPVLIEETTVLSYKAQDPAGNASAVFMDNYTILLETSTNIHLTDLPAWSTDNTPAWSWVPPVGGPAVAGYVYSLDGGPEVFTTSTTYASPLMPDGSHTFVVKVRYDSTPPAYGFPNTDAFGIDTTPPALYGVELNGGALGADNPLVNISLTHDGDGNGIGIAAREASIDGGPFQGFAGDTILLPSEYGPHTAAVRLADGLGHVSEIKADAIVLSYALHTLTGASSSGDNASLRDLRSALSAQTPVIGGQFIFQNVPDGLFGLVVGNAATARPYAGRIALRGGNPFNAGALEPGAPFATITGQITPPLEGVPVSAGLNLGQGLFLDVAGGTTTADGEFTLSGLYPGLYTVKAVPDPLSGYGRAAAVINAAAGMASVVNLNLPPAVRVSGTANRFDAFFKSAGTTGSLTPFYVNDTRQFSVALTTGPRTFFGMTSAFVLDPLAVSVGETPVSQNLVLRALDNSTVGRLTRKSTILQDDAEPGINKSFQLCVFSSQGGSESVPLILGRSEEIDADSPETFRVHDASSAATPVLCVISDELEADIHSANAAPAAETGPFEYDVTGRGANVGGRVLTALPGGPLNKPVVLLKSSTGDVLGVAEGGPDGRYFFKNIPSGAGYRVVAVHPLTGQTARSEPLTLAEGNNIMDFDLTVGLVPRVAITQYPNSFFSGASLFVNVGWENLPSTTNYHLVLRLEDPSSGQVYAETALEQFVSSAAAVLPLDVASGTPSGTNYRFGFYCVSRSAGWSDVAASFQTPQDVQITRDVTPPVLTVPANTVAEAQTLQGAVVTLTATAVDDFDPYPSIMNDAPAVFPMGVTWVTFTARDFSNNVAVASMSVTVADTTPPVLAMPTDVTAEATGTLTPVAIGQATATDIFAVTISNNAPASYALGTTTVTWTATDANGNTAIGYQRVTIGDSTPPVLTVPADVSAEATGVTTTLNIGQATATDIFSVTITNNAPAAYAIGTTTVTWTATDANGNTSTGTQRVTVGDSTPPVLAVPADVTAEATGVTTAVNIGQATATDIFSVTITNNAPAAYAIGMTTVTWTATDANGNTSTGTQRVTVGDTTPPVLTVPADVTTEATGTFTPVAIGQATATDIFAVTIINNAPVSYALGVTTITWTATDANGNTASGAQRITVRDTTPPVLTVPPDVTATATGPMTPVNIGQATATDIFAVTITNNAPAGYPVGTTIVVWTATDANGNVSTGDQQVTVVSSSGTLAIAITSITGDTGELLPGEYWDDRPIVISYSVQAPAGVSPIVTANVGIVDPAARTVKLLPNHFIGDTDVTITANDGLGHNASATVTLRIVLRLSRGGVKIKPNIILVQPQTRFAAIVRMPHSYDVSTVTNVSCDGAPAENVRIFPRFRRFLAVFKVGDITVLPVDKHFVLRGTVQYDGKAIQFQGWDDIKKVIFSSHLRHKEADEREELREEHHSADEDGSH